MDLFLDFDQDNLNGMINQEKEIHYLQELSQGEERNLP
jgi:hypothetical protein